MVIYKAVMIFCGVLLSVGGFAQKEIEIPVNHRVVLNFHEYVVYADILASERKFKPKARRYYFWYNANDIKRTRGGYDGKLLHGEYTEFYPDKNLKRKGQFRYGLKKGTWKTWYHSGEIETVVRWKKGKMHGDFRYYDEEGRLVKQGSHRNDHVHGRIDTFLAGGEKEREVYVKGVKKEPGGKKKKDAIGIKVSDSAEAGTKAGKKGKLARRKDNRNGNEVLEQKAGSEVNKNVKKKQGVEDIGKKEKIAKEKSADTRTNANEPEKEPAERKQKNKKEKTPAASEAEQKAPGSDPGN